MAHKSSFTRAIELLLGHSSKVSAASGGRPPIRPTMISNLGTAVAASTIILVMQRIFDIPTNKAAALKHELTVEIQGLKYAANNNQEALKSLKEQVEELKSSNNERFKALNKRLDGHDKQFEELKTANNELKIANNELKIANNELKTSNNELNRKLDELLRRSRPKHW